jgi:hypothetical protein
MVVSPTGLGPEKTALARASRSFKDRRVLWSEKAPHINRPATDSNKNLVLGPRWELDTKIDWLTVGRNLTLTLRFSQRTAGAQSLWAVSVRSW